MQINPAFEQSKIIRWSESPWNEKVYGGKDLLKSQVLSSEWNTERVREDASGDSEDGEDDELPWVIGEVKETVSDEACEDQWGVRSIDKVQHTEKSD